MRIEHFAYQADDPVAVAQWYVAHMGCRIKRADGPPRHMHFLSDSAGNVLVEIYNHPLMKTPGYRSMDPLLLHIAFCSDDPARDRDRLVAAGATVEDDLKTTPVGDVLAMLRDPWGFAIQLVQRAEPML